MFGGLQVKAGAVPAAPPKPSSLSQDAPKASALSSLSIPSHLVILNTPPTPMQDSAPDLFGAKDDDDDDEAAAGAAAAAAGETAKTDSLPGSKSGSPSPSPPATAAPTSRLLIPTSLFLNVAPVNTLSVPRAPISDPSSPNCPHHLELDRRHSDSANWTRLVDQQTAKTLRQGADLRSRRGPTYQNTDIAGGE